MKKVQSLLAFFLMLACSMATQSCFYVFSDKEPDGSEVESNLVSDGKITTVSYNAKDFSTIDVSGVVNIRFTQGDKYSVVAKGDKNVIDITSVSVKNKNLKISSKKRKITNSKGATIYITAPSLTDINGSGVGSIKLDGKVDINDNFSLNHSGVGSVDIENLICKKLDVNQSGVGSTDIYVKATDIDINKSGVGSSDYNVDCVNLKINASGVGSFKITGKAKTYHKDKSGVGNFKDSHLEIVK